MREVDAYSKGLARALGFSPEEVAESPVAGRWRRRMAEFRRDPVSHWRRGIERRRKLIERYRRLIEKHERAIRRLEKLIETYERREKG